MDKFLITRKSANPVTGPIMVTTSPRITCPLACPLQKNADGSTAGLCYAEHGALGGYVWTLLDRALVGEAILNGIRVFGFDELLYVIRSLPEATLWRHNAAGDLISNNKTTIDSAALRAIVDANRGRRGFTFTHYDVLSNLVNREAIRHANEHGFTVNLSANSIQHADHLADLRIGPVTTILPATVRKNSAHPERAHGCHLSDLYPSGGNLRHVRIVCPPALHGHRFPGDRRTKAHHPGVNMMLDEYKTLPFDQLRTLHREIGALIAEKRSQELEQLRERAALLGFTADDLAPKKIRSNNRKRYQDPNNPENTYAGKGPKPTWLKEALAEGRSFAEFEVN